ncbi:MAG: TlpA family protein disulfide reductase [Bacteroidota bacterium]
MNNKYLVITLLLLSSFITIASSIGSKSISYVLEDQYGNEHKSVNIQGRRQLLFLADRTGSDYTSNWTKVLEPLYRNTIEFVAFADVSSVPGFLKGFIKGKFKDSYSNPILMDWEGKLFEYYNCPDGIPTIVFIDNKGIIRYKISGKGTNSELQMLNEAINQHVSK